MLRITVWNECSKESEDQAVLAVHPEGLLGSMAAIFDGQPGMTVRQAHQDMPDCGMTDELLAETDVLIWWGHVKHHLVPDEIADRVQRAVLKGMGFIALHSAHMAKPFMRLMGTSCTLRWRDGEYERIWCTDPGHPIARGIPSCFELEEEEMYGEYFDVPQPDSQVFIGWFRGGEVFRSGCCWTRGLGKVFYFQPGHETNASFRNPIVKTILANAVRWAAPTNRREQLDAPTHDAAESMVADGRGAELRDILGWK